MNCKEFTESEEFVDKPGIFCVDRKVKRRYINPLTKSGRVYDISKQAKEKIDNYINMKVSKYAYVDM